MLALLAHLKLNPDCCANESATGSTKLESLAEHFAKTLRNTFEHFPFSSPAKTTVVVKIIAVYGENPDTVLSSG